MSKYSDYYHDERSVARITSGPQKGKRAKIKESLSGLCYKVDMELKPDLRPLAKNVSMHAEDLEKI